MVVQKKRRGNRKRKNGFCSRGVPAKEKGSFSFAKLPLCVLFMLQFLLLQFSRIFFLRVGLFVCRYALLWDFFPVLDFLFVSGVLPALGSFLFRFPSCSDFLPALEVLFVQGFS